MTNRYIDSDAPIIVWFRTDLRLKDHPGVAEAVESGRPIIPIYIHDEALMRRPWGAAAKWWLHDSLKVLDEDLRAVSSRLIFAQGDAQTCLDQTISQTTAKTVICSYTFHPEIENTDRDVEKMLKARHVDFRRHNSTLLAPPGSVSKRSGGLYKIFTPFYRALCEQGFCEAHIHEYGMPREWPKPTLWPESLKLEALGLANTMTRSGEDWAKGFNRFSPGEKGALAALEIFINEHLEDYEIDRDRPDKDATSHLSAHLRFGEISPHRIVHELARATKSNRKLANATQKFRSELAWREFCYQLLNQQPDLHHHNFRPEFDSFRWLKDEKGFTAWCRGETGYELVDAGMRELWQTGFMHNRVRMVCASFLIKHLQIDWRRGEEWFWDCLVDADPASNPANWQWVAGSGADASPYYRIFNPITQAAKFDPSGLYRKRYGVGDIPPIIDHNFARQRALDAYGEIKGKALGFQDDQPD